jgi:ubiquinone/menaquinone biosynthesis C-methylase UbiE
MTDEVPATPLHRLEPTTRFTQRTSDYAQHRPGYPAAAFETMLEGLGWPHMIAAADVGAGTCISARQLADFGPLVVAVEPNATMLAAAEPHERVLPHAGTAEDTGLEDRSVMLVLCAQAFHWFDQAASLTEFRRILSPFGRVALLWNVRDESDPFTAGYTALMRAAADRALPDEFDEPAHALQECAEFTNYREISFANQQSLTREGLIGRARSASYCPVAGPAFETLQRGLHDLFERHAANGCVPLVYRTRLFLAEPAG